MKNILKALIVALVVLLIFIVCRRLFLAEKNSVSEYKEVLTHSQSQNNLAAQDGKGKAVVIPDSDVVVSSPGTWKIVYTAGQEGIAKGGGVAFHISPFWGWTAPQNYSPEAPGYVTGSCSNRDVELEIVPNQRLKYVIARPVNRPLVLGDTITLVYGDTQNGKNPGAFARADKYAEQEERFFIKTDSDGDGHFFAIEHQPSINILPASASYFIVTAPSIVVENIPFPVTIAAVDRNDNRVTTYAGKPSITSSRAGALFVEDQADSWIRVFECIIKEQGVYQFTADDRSNNLSGKSNPVICKKKSPRLKLFWADLHGHSNLSDGTGTAEDYFHYARFVSGLDAVALTDHDAWGFELLDEHEHIWESIKNTANQLYEPGRFVTFMGYEWTNWTYGHKHVLFFDEPAPLYSYRSKTSDAPDELWGLLKNCRAITVSHHVGGGPVAADWNFNNPGIEPIVEICSVHGNSEYYGCPASIYNPKKGAFVQDALAAGYTLGIVASGDTHNGHPGRGDPMSSTGGIAGIYAEELTRESLWDAIKKRRVYGTTGDRIIIDFKINGHWMGEVATEKNNAVRKIYIDVTGADIIRQIDIVKNNNNLKTWRENKQCCTHIFEDAEKKTGRDYYYLRITQENGQMAWSSPIWLERAGNES